MNLFANLGRQNKSSALAGALRPGLRQLLQLQPQEGPNPQKYGYPEDFVGPTVEMLGPDQQPKPTPKLTLNNPKSPEVTPSQAMSWMYGGFRSPQSQQQGDVPRLPNGIPMSGPAQRAGSVAAPESVDEGPAIQLPFLTPREQRNFVEWFTTPQGFGKPKGGYVPGTGDVPTVVEDKDEFGRTVNRQFTPPATNPNATGDGDGFDQSAASSPPLSNAEPDAPLTTDEKYRNLDMALGGSLYGQALGETQNILQKYGKLAQSLQGAKDALRAEFEGTPELDQIIGETQKELSTVRGTRKQPGVGEFLALALMNLANKDFKNNAYLVLGTGEQRENEKRLEDRLFQLEGGRASQRLQGRRMLQRMLQQDRMNDAKQQRLYDEMTLEQKGDEQDRDFKNQKLGFDKLMQQLGQLRQQSSTASEADRKALQKYIDSLDPYKRAQQQPQPASPPKDNRQSRMFGALYGGGYA